MKGGSWDDGRTAQEDLFPDCRVLEADPGVLRCDRDACECFKVHERAQEIYEKADKTQFATEIIAATVNLIDRLMRENGE